MTPLDAEARASIGDLNARFAWALDLHDFDALRTILAEDVHYISIGREFHDAEAVIASFRARTGARTTRHGLGNLLLEPAGGDEVRGRSSWHTFASNDDPPPPGVPVFMVADFSDLYRRTALGWRIAERIITPVFRDPALAPAAAIPHPS
ncbi:MULTISPECIES: nuclear transport factor 2 family protein [Microbacterium]|uniref:Nuclear transport factor 2 family protein n=1 Tax=Microbacterium wangchenii TaxID=2541726 RepID=A0ABX5SRU2_9MICO|nr:MULTISPECIES: nuclear transport factor 2 family protein [Microbacterium]MCK6066688.1 nuclear transport factor 2 family protein [Microbacterium sp. EYE_512]QBR88015.1 nuclear transport factor 2 family protein [Microbacterium wangchenii]TFV83867.1 nuclear transport factor 2 family protein [Microbacterium sp. dk485]TXK18195.1 nuclear transport factor 2 family protein [Microbacterium wangchenii]